MTNATFYLSEVKKFRDACGIHQVDDDLHLDLLNEESLELSLARAHKDKAQMADGYADCVVIMAGWAIDATPPVEWNFWIEQWEEKAAADGINLKGAFDLVHESNMTKLCTKAHIGPTTDKYMALGVELEWREASDDLWSAHAANDSDHAPRHKLLKPTGYKEPDWSQTERWVLNDAT